MQHVLSVTDINRYIKEIVTKDLVLSNLWVRGEISNFKNHYSGHMYFTIKDESGVLKCIMFKTNNSNLVFVPENGMKVLIRGYVSVYERDGQYQLYALEMQPDGLGNLHIAFEQLKKKLMAEGFFDEAHKKKIPYLPERICVISSSTGSVIRDIINVLSRRFPNVQLKLYPVAVQGEGASLQIARAIKKVNELDIAEVIIIARGGGSLEELWAFNEEVVARSIYASRIPVISAVGHETDFTISDFVADLRAPTPSAAAELVVPEQQTLQNRILNLNIRLRSAVMKKYDSSRSTLDKINNSSIFRQPFDRIYQERMRIDVKNRYLIKGLQMNFEKSKSKFAFLSGKLDALSPLKVILRGYSITRSIESGIVIKSINDVKPNENVEISLSDGQLKCIVQEKSKRLDVKQ